MPDPSSNRSRKRHRANVAFLIVVFLALTGYLPGLRISTIVQAYTVPKEAKYLVAFFEFTDLPHSKSIDQLRDIASTQVQDYYSKVSYGKLKLTADLLPDWITLPLKVKQMKLFEWNYDDGQMQTVDATARGRLAQLGIGAGKYVATFIVYAGKVWAHAFPATGVSFENEYEGYGVFCHELGHAIGHLPDLYSYGLSEQSKPSGVWLGPWDLMSWSIGGFTSWSLIRLGWLDKSHITDVSESVHRTFIVDALENATGQTHLLRVQQPGSTITYYVEVRENFGVDQDLYYYYPNTKFGVLIYLVDGSWALECCGQSDEGQVKIVDSRPNSFTNPEDDLLDAPFNIGRNNIAALINQPKDLSIIVLSRSGYTYSVMIANALMGNQAITANNIIADAQDSVSGAQIESRLNGLEPATEQLAKAKASYAAGQFADSIEAAKSASEMANAATKPQTATSTLTTSQQNEQSTSTASQASLPLPQPVLIIGVVLVSIGVAAALFTKTKFHKKRSN